MQNKNYIFIARSLDGYIADREGGVEWLHEIPNPDNLDMGYNKFMERIDAIVMGRKTFEVVLGFGIPWPYTKPVYVVSSVLKSIPEELDGKVQLVNGSINEILLYINGKGDTRLYIDGGTLIQSFLKEDLIDEMIISTIPVLIGGGVPLFRELEKKLQFEHVKSQVFLNAITQDTYRRKR